MRLNAPIPEISNAEAVIIAVKPQAMADVLRKPESHARLAKVGFDARGEGPAAAAEQVRTNVARWSGVIARAGIKPGDVQ